MYAKQAKTTVRKAYSSSGHASIFLALMEVDEPPMRFVVASVVGIGPRHGARSDTEIAANVRGAATWAVKATKRRLGTRVVIRATGRKERVKK